MKILSESVIEIESEINVESEIEVECEVEIESELAAASVYIARASRSTVTGLGAVSYCLNPKK